MLEQYSKYLSADDGQNLQPTTALADWESYQAPCNPAVLLFSAVPFIELCSQFNECVPELKAKGLATEIELCYALCKTTAMVYSPADKVLTERRSFLGALLAALPLLEPGKSVAQPVHSENRRRAFLQILAGLLEMDAAAALNGPSQSFILKEFLAILATRSGCLSP